jgi:DNA-directed RNA polymerase subunit M/transcription elongation factor TFIIS
MSKIVDITGKKTVKCSKCGFTIKISPREIDIEKLKHIKDVEKISKLLKNSESDTTFASNIRILICPKCNYAIICKDEFTQT